MPEALSQAEIASIEALVKGILAAVKPKKKAVAGDPPLLDNELDDTEPDFDGDEGTGAGAGGAVAKSFTFGVTVAFEKADESTHTIYGWGNVSSVNGRLLKDLQGDVIPLNELRKAAQEFMVESRIGDVMHWGPDTGVIVESVIVDPDFRKAMGATNPREGWWVGYRVTSPEVWTDYLAGKLRGFSIAGSGERVTVQDS